jgi:hypothetical protein
MENSNTQEINTNDLIAKYKDETLITILIQDLEQTSNLMKSDIEKYLVSRIVKVLNESYLKREREMITKFSFGFYADLSCQMKVPENLISENLTHAEIYFDQKFNRNNEIPS